MSDEQNTSVVDEKKTDPEADKVQPPNTQTTAPEITPEKELFSWKAPARSYRKRDREFWLTVIAIATIFGLILFVAEGIMPVILIISLVFLYHVLSTVEPEEITYRLTNYGVKIGLQRTDWVRMLRFWFTKRSDTELLVFETSFVPGRLELVINPKDKDQLIKVLSKYIPHEEAPPSNLDRAANYLSEKLPGNN